MTATYTFDVFSSLDGYGAASGDWTGYWGKQGPRPITRRCRWCSLMIPCWTYGRLPLEPRSERPGHQVDCGCLVDGGQRLRQPHAKVIERIPLSDPHAAADGSGDDRQGRRVDRRVRCRALASDGVQRAERWRSRDGSACSNWPRSPVSGS
jgi:hypothetical protein